MSSIYHPSFIQTAQKLVKEVLENNADLDTLRFYLVSSDGPHLDGICRRYLILQSWHPEERHRVEASEEVKKVYKE